MSNKPRRDEARLEELLEYYEAGGDPDNFEDDEATLDRVVANLIRLAINGDARARRFIFENVDGPAVRVVEEPDPGGE